MLNHLSSILLDFDGTLVDSSKGIYNAFCSAAYQVGLEPPTLCEFKELIGPTIDKIASQLYPNVEQSLLAELHRQFRHNYDSTHYANTCWYPGTLETLVKIKDRFHLSLCIVTNKPTQISRKILVELDTPDIFDEVVGNDYLELRDQGVPFTSKSAAIDYTLDKLRYTSSSAIYLGDTMSDFSASVNSNVAFIAATYGFYDWRHKIPSAARYIQSITELFVEVEDIYSNGFAR